MLVLPAGCTVISMVILSGRLSCLMLGCLYCFAIVGRHFLVTVVWSEEKDMATI